MNTQEMHGKKISEVWWPDTDDESCRVMESTDKLQLEMNATHHGDHDEFWIVEYHNIDGEMKETARHNPRFTEGWSWA